MMTRNETADWLLSHDRYAILTHTRPDGDTIGSATALCLGLRQLGREAWVIDSGEVSPFLSRCCDGLTKSWPEDGDTIISVDVAAPRMLPEAFQTLLGRIALRIDHHESATSYTELELVDHQAAACGDIIYDVLMAMGVEMNKELAWRLYIAVSTDTGCFRYANTNAHCYQVAAVCAQTGANLYPITQELFDTNSLGKLKIQSYILENAQFLCNGRAAVCVIPKTLEENTTKEDMEGVPGFLRSIEGVKIAATIRQSETGSKISVRAVPGFDAAEVCGKFGGGGHKGAAGAGLDLPLSEAAAVVAKALQEAVEGV